MCFAFFRELFNLGRQKEHNKDFYCKSLLTDLETGHQLPSCKIGNQTS